jgi:hypothetical protein
MMEQEYVSTNYSDGVGNRINVIYDILLTDNYLETVSNYNYYMTLGASLGSAAQVKPLQFHRITFNYIIDSLIKNMP